MPSDDAISVRLSMVQHGRRLAWKIDKTTLGRRTRVSAMSVGKETQSGYQFRNGLAHSISVSWMAPLDRVSSLGAQILFSFSFAAKKVNFRLPRVTRNSGVRASAFG
jgi:hypothetical protein